MTTADLALGEEVNTLYKFVAHRDAVVGMAQGSLKFTETAKLNDPSELSPLMNGEAVCTSLSALRETGYDERQFEWLGRQEALLRLLSPETRRHSRPATAALASRTLSSPVYDDLPFMEEEMLKTISLIRSRVGVLSLTERFDSLAMWAHYGAQAKGYVMEIDGLDDVFCGDDTGSLDLLKSVSYVDELAGLTHDPSTQNNLFFSKFQDWSYEREWRVVSALSACKLTEQGFHVRSVDRRCVSGVILGWNVTALDAARIASDLRCIRPEFRVRIASLERGRVVLKNASH